MRYYRSKSEIYIQILNSCDHEEATKVTRIMYTGMLSYKQLKNYIKDLVNKGMLEQKGESTEYSLTNKGRIVLAKLIEVEELFNNGS
jgi:predicted transcriptional regulator